MDIAVYLSLIMCICEVYIIHDLAVDKSPLTHNASCFMLLGYHASIQTGQTKYMPLPQRGRYMHFPNRLPNTKLLMNNSVYINSPPAAWIKPQASHLTPKQAPPSLLKPIMSSLRCQYISTQPSIYCNIPYVSRNSSTPVLKPQDFKSSKALPKP